MSEELKETSFVSGFLCIFLLISIQFLTSKFTKLSSPEYAYLELQRRLQHMFSGLAIIYCFHSVLPLNVSIFILFFVCFLFIIFHKIRRNFPKINENLFQSFGTILREHERVKMPSAFFMLFACLILLTLKKFHYLTMREITISMLAAAVGDPAGGIVGTWHSKKFREKSYDKSKIYAFHSFFARRLSGTKSVAGTLAMFAVSFVMTAFYLCFFTTLSLLSLLWYSIWASAIAAFVELHWLLFNDNFAIPVFTSLALAFCTKLGLLPTV